MRLLLSDKDKTSHCGQTLGHRLKGYECQWGCMLRAPITVWQLVWPSSGDSVHLSHLFQFNSFYFSSRLADITNKTLQQVIDIYMNVCKYCIKIYKIQWLNFDLWLNFSLLVSDCWGTVFSMLSIHLGNKTKIVSVDTIELSWMMTVLISMMNSFKWKLSVY